MVTMTFIFLKEYKWIEKCVTFAKWKKKEKILRQIKKCDKDIKKKWFYFQIKDTEQLSVSNWIFIEKKN